MKNWCFSTNISLYVENGTRYGNRYTMKDEQELVRFLSNGVISNDLQ